MSTTDTVTRDAAVRDFQLRPTALRLRAAVQHYAWGSADFIPSLLGIPNPDEEPFAELWMGAHPDLPSVVELGGGEMPLNELIEQSAGQVLGPKVGDRFAGKLPYLFKVLSAAVPLSIQVHPTKKQAEEGFARENAANVPLAAPHRNYKDDNHKPEILAALTNFYALRGFRPLEEIGEVLADVPELQRVMPDYQATPVYLKSLYQKLMTLSQEEVDAILNPLISRFTAADREKPFGPADREYWLLEADRRFSLDGLHDRGLFSIYLLNLVHLRPGEAVYLPAGVLHAYLRGSGMELMANSNNVLRGGLTPKHVDVPELLRSVVFEGGPAQVIKPVAMPDGVERAYKTPAAEFELRRIDVSSDRSFRTGTEHGADIVIFTDAAESTEVTLSAGGEQMRLRKGDIVFAPVGVDFSVSASAPATLFRATVPEAAADGTAGLSFRGR
jgi:mannose-6-phosphate isomerase class I